MAVVIKQSKGTMLSILLSKAAASSTGSTTSAYLGMYNYYEFQRRSTVMALPYLSLQNLGDEEKSLAQKEVRSPSSD
jgi:hypothetical protein